MSRFRKKPVVIEAVQLTRAVIEAHLFDRAPLPEGLKLWDATYHAGNRTISHAKFGIKTLEGNMEATDGDWIIKGVAGEFYPCKPDIFAATYEPVAEDDTGEQDNAKRCTPSQATQKGDGWRTINSAPKDGTELLLIYEHKASGSRYRKIGCWASDVSGWDIGTHVVDSVICWQPLPTPPSPTQEDET